MKLCGICGVHLESMGECKVHDCELGSIDMLNFVFLTIYHTITVKIHGGHTREEKVYQGKKGEEWWTTYRFQLEALVD